MTKDPIFKKNHLHSKKVRRSRHSWPKNFLVLPTMLLAQKTSHLTWTLGQNPPKPWHPNPHGLPDTQHCGSELEIEQSLLDPGVRKMENPSHKPILHPNKPHTHKHLPLQVHQLPTKHPPLQICPTKPNHWWKLEHPPQIPTPRKAPLGHMAKHLPHPRPVWHLQTQEHNP